MAAKRINLILFSIFAAYLIISFLALIAEAGDPKEENQVVTEADKPEEKEQGTSKADKAEEKEQATSSRKIFLVEYQEGQDDENGTWIITDADCYKKGKNINCNDSTSTSKKSGKSSVTKKSTKRIAEVQLESNGIPSTKADLKLLDLLTPKKV